MPTRDLTAQSIPPSGEFGLRPLARFVCAFHTHILLLENCDIVASKVVSIEGFILALYPVNPLRIKRKDEAAKLQYSNTTAIYILHVSNRFNRGVHQSPK